MAEKTVASTSINHVPAGVKRAVELNVLTAGMRALDWGGGRYNATKIYLANHGIDMRVYDPYARSEKECTDAITWALVKDELPDVVFLNNVLCVIQDVAERRRVLQAAWRYVRKGGYLITTTYEGNKSGVVKGFQNNKLSSEYIEEIKAALGSNYFLLKEGKVYFWRKLP